VTGEFEEAKPTPCFFARDDEKCDADDKLWEPKDDEAPTKSVGFV
jgi:hypothetical protein